MQLTRLSTSPHPNVSTHVLPPFRLDVAGSTMLCQVFELCDYDVMSLVEYHGGALPEPVAAHVFRGVVDGLLHSHGQSVFHLGTCQASHCCGRARRCPTHDIAASVNSYRYQRVVRRGRVAMPTTGWGYTRKQAFADWKALRLTRCRCCHHPSCQM